MNRHLCTTGLLIAALVLAGCTNPDASTTSATHLSTTSTQNAGEPPAPPPPSPTSQAPVDVQPTAAKAINLFAGLYVNWTYRTLVTHQRRLAAMAVGPARLAEQQAAAAASADSTISRGHIENRGQIVSIAPDRAQPGAWVLVTREQTTGNSQYAGLPAAFHVTIVDLAHLPGGWAIQQWLPQS